MQTSAAAALASVIALGAIAALSAGCPPPRDGRPVSRCFADCRAHASERCSDDDCERGCRFVLDRVVEREDTAVLTCVAASSACTDETWARCAARIGPHADGGPPVPPAPGAEVSSSSGAGEGEGDLDRDASKSGP
jgi:hypothetical protein